MGAGGGMGAPTVGRDGTATQLLLSALQGQAGLPTQRWLQTASVPAVAGQLDTPLDVPYGLLPDLL